MTSSLHLDWWSGKERLDWLWLRLLFVITYVWILSLIVDGGGNVRAEISQPSPGQPPDHWVIFENSSSRSRRLLASQYTLTLLFQLCYGYLGWWSRFALSWWASAALFSFWFNWTNSGTLAAPARSGRSGVERPELLGQPLMSFRWEKRLFDSVCDHQAAELLTRRFCAPGGPRGLVRVSQRIMAYASLMKGCNCYEYLWCCSRFYRPGWDLQLSLVPWLGVGKLKFR